MMRTLLLVGMAVSALGLMQATPAIADEWDKKMVLMSSQTTEAGQSDRASRVVRATVGVEQEGQTVRSSLPQASSLLTLIVLIGCVGICLGSLLMHFRKPVPVAADR